MIRLDRLRAVPAAVLTAALFVFLPWAGAAADPERPNILVIMADDLGWGDLGCFGAADLETPHIDSLAAAGMHFTNFHAASTVCSPTRAALMTGRHPDLAGVPGVIRTDPANSWGYLSPTLPTLPQKLKERDYRTALIGKWRLGLTSPNLPNQRGFDYFKGFLGDMMDDYRAHRRHGINYMRENLREIDPEGHATDLFADWASEWIAESAHDHARKPFFLYLAFNAPHVPIQPPAADLARVRARRPDLSPA